VDTCARAPACLSACLRACLCDRTVCNPAPLVVPATHDALSIAATPSSFAATPRRHITFFGITHAHAHAHAKYKYPVPVLDWYGLYIQHTHTHTRGRYRSDPPDTVLDDYAALRALIVKHASTPAEAALPILSGEWGYTTAVAPCSYGNRVDELTQARVVVCALSVWVVVVVFFMGAFAV
jgi:hypothetical protein